MKELEDLKERMNQHEEIVNALVQKTTTLENKDTCFPEAIIPDYQQDFLKLEKHLKDDAIERNKQTGEIKDLIKRYNLQYPAQKIQDSLEQLTKLYDQTAQLIPIKHHHKFDLQTKGWIIGGVLLLIITALTTGSCFYLLAANGKLQANALEFRMIRQVYPAQANWAERYYNSNPDAMEQTTSRLEDEARKRSDAQNLDIQSKRYPKNAKSKQTKK